jgi:hypothetical protein
MDAQKLIGSEKKEEREIITARGNYFTKKMKSS